MTFYYPEIMFTNCGPVVEIVFFFGSLHFSCINFNYIKFHIILLKGVQYKKNMRTRSVGTRIHLFFRVGSSTIAVRRDFIN